MKRILKLCIIIFVIVFITTNESKAQVSFQIGYSAGFPTGVDSLNYVIDRYNVTRNYLDESMKNINYLDGFTISMGAIFDYFFMDIGYTGGIQRRSAEGIISSKKFRRDLKVSNHSFDFNFGLCVTGESKGGVFVGASVHSGLFLINSRVGEITSSGRIEEDYKNIIFELNLSYGFFVRFCLGNPGLYIQPFVQFSPKGIFAMDITDLNQAINPNTYTQDPTPLKINPGIFGVKVGFSLISYN
ncbi:MAG: hypothetical protein H6Q25_151 [Bacteroidetes bacterium]|nr:hypothetical protein [Bacteroidota bacterium]